MTKYRLKDETGYFYVFSDLDAMSEFTGLSIDEINNLLEDRLPSCNGWEKVEWKVISPRGEIFTVTNISKFAKEHGLNRGSLSYLLRGETKTVKGWKLENYKKRLYKIKDGNGVVHQFSNITRFARNHNIDSYALKELLMGREEKLWDSMKECIKGWTRVDD